jgi:hypothetical protein
MSSTMATASYLGAAILFVSHSPAQILELTGNSCLGVSPLLGLALMGIAGFVATPILGLIYGYLSYYIPFIYLNALLAIAYLVVLEKAADAVGADPAAPSMR